MSSIGGVRKVFFLCYRLFILGSILAAWGQRGVVGLCLVVGLGGLLLVNIVLVTADTMTRRGYAFFFPGRRKRRMAHGYCATGKGLSDVLICHMSRICSCPSNARTVTDCAFSGTTNGLVGSKRVMTHYGSKSFSVDVGNTTAFPTTVSVVGASMCVVNSLVGCPSTVSSPASPSSSGRFSSTAVHLCRGKGGGGHTRVALSSQHFITARDMSAPTNPFCYAGVGCSVSV